jgi:hypothetical protein
MFTSMCILCGCDYADSIKGVGVKKAHALMRENKTIENIMRRLRLDGALAIPHNYVDAFQLAFSTFRHQVVFDPRTREAVHFTPLSNRMRERYPACGELDFLGELLSKDVACGIADGSFDPMTRAPFVTSLRMGGAATSSSSSQYRPSASAPSIMMASWLHSTPSALENRSHNLPPVPESSPVMAVEQSDAYFAHHLKGPSTFCLSDSRPAAPVGSTGRSSTKHHSVQVQSVYFRSATSSVVVSSPVRPASELIKDDAPAGDSANANVESIPEAIATAAPFAVSCDAISSRPCPERSSSALDVFARMGVPFTKRKRDALAAPDLALPMASYSGVFAPLHKQESYRASPIASAFNRSPSPSRQAHAPPKRHRVSLPQDSKSNSRHILGGIGTLHELSDRRSFHGERVGVDVAGLDAFKYSRGNR